MLYIVSHKTTGSEFDTAKEGYEYVIVSVKIENKSDEKISYNPFDWKVENSNGQEVDTAFTTVNSDTGLKLNYYYNSLFDEDASFKIKLE